MTMNTSLLNKASKAVALAALVGAFTACNDYLDITPPSQVSPETYFTTAEQLGYYTVNYYCTYSNWDAGSYGNEFPSHADYTSWIHDDMGTDNEASSSCGNEFYEGSDYKVGATGGKWNFSRINDLNFFIRTVRPKVENNEIGGDPDAVNHYFGEGYFLRALEYFFRLHSIGASNSIPSNPYYDMFATLDPSGYDEVLMYREYNREKAGGHSLNQYHRQGQPRGFTQEYANAFLMDNGLPIYDPASGYKGDDFISDTKEGRDWRWRLFMKAPGEYVYAGTDDRIGASPKYEAPVVYSSSIAFCTSTGYKKGKAFTTDTKYTSTGTDETASIIYRAAEAYLIYMEAAWEMYGDNLDATAWDYWSKLRQRAGVDPDPHKTIAATNLDLEEYYTHDLALYSAGQRITSPTLYNIRRERRCEFISEGMRKDDLLRWRALDQLIDNKYFVHGAKIFGPMLASFPKNKLKYDQADPKKNNVSSPTDTEGGFNGDPNYLSMFRISTQNKFYNSGMTWHMAHYLSPIAASHFLESSADGSDIATSPIYQNPYWPTTADAPATR